MAEPAIQVLAKQVEQIAEPINNIVFLFVVGFGTGIAVAFAIYRIIRNINIKIVFLVLYLAIFALVFFVPSQYQALAFDASGATTGDISVPLYFGSRIGYKQNGQ